MTEPATPFWEGYRRSPEIEAQLVAAITHALHTNPTQRFGQLVVNLFGADPFYVWDEDAISTLLGDNGP